MYPEAFICLRNIYVLRQKLIKYFYLIYKERNDDNLYNDSINIDDSHCVNYGSINFARNPIKNITKDIINDINCNNSKYKEHNIIDEDYLNNVKSKLQIREEDTNKFSNKEAFQFDVDNTAGYGILDQLGINYDDTLKLSQSDRDINRAYNKLLYDRQN